MLHKSLSNQYTDTLQVRALPIPKKNTNNKTDSDLGNVKKVICTNNNEN
jgi:hypothetical protein